MLEQKCFILKGICFQMIPFPTVKITIFLMIIRKMLVLGQSKEELKQARFTYMLIIASQPPVFLILPQETIILFLPGTKQRRVHGAPSKSC